MKSLLVMPRWSEEESLFPSSGRPYLDLLLHGLGFSHLDILELEPDAPFHPLEREEAYRLILIQSQCRHSSGRLRRSILSNLGLSLGLDGEESGRLRVVGARPLYDSFGKPAGFAIKRRGRIVAFFERSIWELRMELVHVVRAMLDEEPDFRRPRFDSCWLLEGFGQIIDLSQWMTSEDAEQCLLRHLPNGDAALMISSSMGDEFKTRLRQNLNHLLYAITPQPLEEILGQKLREARLKVATAESCTAGLIAARLASVPGSSAYLSAGFITYSNQAKTRNLDVPEVLLQRCGAVSPEVALSMARNALKNSDDDLAVSTTGIAGPDGGTHEKPVGTVFLAAVSRHGGSLEHKALFQGNRDRVRFQTSQTALHLLRRIMDSKT